MQRAYPSDLAQLDLERRDRVQTILSRERRSRREERPPVLLDRHEVVERRIGSSPAPEIEEPLAFNRQLDLALDSHGIARSEEHTSELQSRLHLVCRLLLEKKKNRQTQAHSSQHYQSTA